MGISKWFQKNYFQNKTRYNWTDMDALIANGWYWMFGAKNPLNMVWGHQQLIGIMG